MSETQQQQQSKEKKAPRPMSPTTRAANKIQAILEPLAPAQRVAVLNFVKAEAEAAAAAPAQGGQPS